jgi:LAO/AO transport system kinase
MRETDRAKQDVEETAKAIRAGDRVALARAITLVESAKREDQARAEALLERLMPFTGQAIRVGISGVPGAGKSTLIDQLGLNLTAQGHTVAVLAVDPTSSRSGGSILGDKTRMGRLAAEPKAFIRPSPAGDSLGGVTKTTRESVALAEAAGYDVILVETVGVGQSETAVSNMVDVFVVVAIPGAGDELQGIKRGLNEWADVVAVNKADADRATLAQRTRGEFEAAFQLLRGKDAPRVSCVSARDGSGVDELWRAVEERHAALLASGELERRRVAQRKAELGQRLALGLMREFTADPARRQALERAERDVEAGAVLAAEAVERLLRRPG